MSKFLETLVRSESKSCSGKIQFPREDSAQRCAADMMKKKPGETFEHYKCAFGDHWHIGHRTSFDWIPASHKSFCLLLIQYKCGACGHVYLTSTVISNRIVSHFPSVLIAQEFFARCLKCKAEQGQELARKIVELANLPDDSTETAESLWEGQPCVIGTLASPSLSEENLRLRKAVRNQCGDNLCWLTDPEVGKALPEAEFLESCRRYHAQLVAENGVIAPGSMTVAQLEARVQELEEELVRYTNAAKEWWKAPPNPEK